MLAAAALAAAFVVAILIPSEVAKPSSRPTLGASLLVLASLLGLLGWLSLGRRALLPEVFGRDSTPSVAARLAGDFVDRYNHVERWAFAELTLQSAEHVNRVIEQADLLLGRIRIVLTRELTAPAAEIVDDGDETEADAGAYRLLMPVLRREKGALIDELVVTVDKDERPTLGREENVAAALALCSQLYEWAFHPGSPLPEDDRLLASLHELAASPERCSESGRYAIALADLKARPHDTTVSGASAQAAKGALVGLLQYLADHYYVFIEIPVEPGGRYLVRVCYSQPRGDFLRSGTNRLKIFLGLGVHRYQMDLPHAMETTSYHFRCRAPEGMYLESGGPELAVVEGGDGQRVTLSTDAKALADEAYVRMSATFGHDLVHLYASNLHTSLAWAAAHRQVRLLMDFRALPPGLLGPVALLSAYLSTVTVVAAVFHDQVFGDEPQGRVAIALVLGVPAIMSGWVAGRFHAKALEVSSPTLVLELGTLLMISGAAVSAAALKSGVDVRASQELALAGVTLTLEHPTWFVVTAAAVAHTIVCVGDLALRHQRYLSALRRGTPVLPSAASKVK